MYATLYTEKRESSRMPGADDIYYSCCVYDQEIVPWWSEKMPTTSFNESPAGICILTHRHLRKGTRLKLGSGRWETGKVGSVRWCRSIGVGRYKAGISLRA